MLTIKHGKESYQIKNDLDELLIKEFEFIASLINDQERAHIDKWSDILIYLGLPEEVVYDLDAEDFLNIVEQFNLITVQNEDIAKTITVDGIEYVAFDEKFRLPVREMGMIETAVRKNKDRYIAEILAIIYKNPLLDKALKYDKAHIHHKAEIFRKELTIDVAVPILAFLGQTLIKQSEDVTSNG